MKRLLARLSPLLLLSALSGAVVAVPGSAHAAAVYDNEWQLVTAGLHDSSAAVGNFPAGRLAVIGDLTGHLRAIAGSGVVVWDRIVDPVAGQAAAVESSPAVGDIDGSGQDSVVVGAGAIDPRSRSDNGGVVAYDGNGNVRWRFQTRDTLNVYTNGPPDGKSDGVIGSPAIGDVNGDGVPDVVFASLDHFVYALNGRTGVPLPGFPYDSLDTVFSSPALFDSDGDGRMEIAIGGDATPNPLAGLFAKGYFRVLDVVGNTVQVRVQRTFDDIVMSSPAIGDIDGDGRMEAVFSTGGYYNDSADSRAVWAVHLDDGSDVRGWPVHTEGLLRTSPALGDVIPGDGGRPEVVIGDLDGGLYAIKGTGEIVWHTTPGSQAGGRGNNGNGFDGGPTIADLDGNGTQDIAMPYGLGGALLVNGANGTLQRVVGGTRYASVSAPAVVDFGGGAGRQLIIGGFSPADPLLAPGAITAVRLPATSAVPAWPLFHKDARRLGAPVSGGDPLPPGYCARNSNPPAVPNAAAGPGYWALAQRGGLFSYDAPFYGSPAGTGLPVPSQAMAVRPERDGYWVVGPSGAIQNFGDAPWRGDPRGLPLSAPVVAIVATASGNGYWVVTQDGAVFSYGDAPFYGSLGSIGVRTTSPVVDAARTATGRGYWLITANGAVFTFGDAPFHGTVNALRDPVVSIGVSPDGAGYWLLARDGGVFSFDVPYAGSIAGIGLCNVPDLGVALVPTKTGRGYWVIAGKGGIFSFGDAPFRGAPGGQVGADTIVGMKALG